MLLVITDALKGNQCMLPAINLAMLCNVQIINSWSPVEINITACNTDHTATYIYSCMLSKTLEFYWMWASLLLADILPLLKYNLLLCYTITGCQTTRPWSSILSHYFSWLQCWTYNMVLPNNWKMYIIIFLFSFSTNCNYCLWPFLIYTAWELKLQFFWTFKGQTTSNNLQRHQEWTCPESMTCLTFFPKPDPEATTALNMSP